MKDTDMADIFQSEFMHWVVFSLGTVNLLSGLAVFSSCRVIPRSWIPARITGSGAYQNFYRYHGVIWQVFWTSVVVHIGLASLHAGLPWMH